jgi:hypothetical protein
MKTKISKAKARELCNINFVIMLIDNYYIAYLARRHKLNYKSFLKCLKKTEKKNYNKNSIYTQIPDDIYEKTYQQLLDAEQYEKAGIAEAIIKARKKNK